MNITSSFFGLIRSINLLLNILVALWLGLCQWTALYNPADKPSLLSLISFTIFFALLANVFYIILWLFSKRKWRSLISIITIVLCWKIVAPICSFNFFGNEGITGSTKGSLKIMTWNVHLFDLGEWTKDKTSQARILKFIKDENPDILCMQEFYWDEKTTLEPYTALIQQLGYPFVEFSKENKLKKNFITNQATKGDVIFTGHAVFSKYPLRNQQRYPLTDKGYNMLSVEAVIDSSHIFCINVLHLTSVGLGRNEMSYIEEVKTKGVDAQDEHKSKSLLRKLRDASFIRAGLANRIDSLKRRMDYPQIICGDFNDVPGSYVYTRVKGRLSDAFVGKGIGLGRTYQHIFPTLRIDYIFYDADYLKVEKYKSPYIGLSDHYPVIATFSFKDTVGL